MLVSSLSTWKRPNMKIWRSWKCEAGFGEDLSKHDDVTAEQVTPFVQSYFCRKFLLHGDSKFILTNLWLKYF